MNVSIDSYRASIGIWHLTCLKRNSRPKKTLLSPIKIKVLLGLILSSYGVFIGILLILRSGDVELNPGPNYQLKSLSVAHINIQSIYPREDRGYSRRKIDEIETTLINDMKTDIICLSETWLKPNILDEDIDIIGYKFCRKDRLEARSGGVAMYINEQIPNRRALEFELPELEIIWVELVMGLKKVLIGAGYRPPKQSVDEVDNFISLLQESLDRIFHRKFESIVLLGDFNDVCTDWEADHNSSDLKLKLYDLINVNDLHQTIREPTHISTTFANLLDILITDSPGYIINQQILPPIGSNHQIVKAQFKIQYKRDKAYQRDIWDYKKGDYVGLNRDIGLAPWRLCYEFYEEIDDITDFWYGLYSELCRSKVPNRTIKIRPNDKPWITREVKQSIKTRNRLFKRFHRYGF